MTNDPNRDLEELLATANLIAARSPDTPAQPVSSRRSTRRPGVLWIGAGAAAAIALGVGVAVSGGDDTDDSGAAATPSGLVSSVPEQAPPTEVEPIATTPQVTEPPGPATTLPSSVAPVAPITLPPLAEAPAVITLPPVAVSLAPPSTQAPAPADDVAATASTQVQQPTPQPVQQPGADVTAVQPLSAEQKGELLVVNGSVRSVADQQALLARLVGIEPRRLRNQTYVNPASGEIPNDLVVTVRDGLQFAAEDATIDSATGRLALDAIGDLLTARPDVVVRVAGHTDNIGSDSYNLQLARRRAQAAVDYLAAQGVDVSRVEVIAVGEANPIAGNDTPIGRLANRRLEISISGILKE